VHNRAQEHFEERALETLFLACGMATWTNGRRTALPAATVLLAQARLAPRGAAHDEFEAAVTGEMEVSPTLLQMLQSEFNCRVDPDELLSQGGIEGSVDTLDELDVAYRLQCVGPALTSGRDSWLGRSRWDVQLREAADGQLARIR
jgi:hypothetical protein